MIKNRPKRPYKNISDFRKQNHRGDSKRLEDVNFYPCLSCDGYGKVRDTRDCDPIEGYKLAPWYKCDRCKGTGKTSRKHFRQVYYNILQKYRKEREDWKREEELRKQGLSRLSDDERKALGI